MGGSYTTECHILDTENNKLEQINDHPGEEHKTFHNSSPLKIGNNLYALGEK